MNGPLTSGSLIADRYRVDSFVGEGGMQYVHKAFDVVSNRDVALKTPKNSSAVKRFHRSAVLAARVNHPNVAKTLDYVRAGRNRFLIEELVAGDHLANALLTQTKFVDPSLAARLFHHLAKGIAAAHHAGVIHRDLKPSNVLIVGGYSFGELKITDFGIAKMADEELAYAVEQGDETISNSKTALGALPYMAPEAIDTPRSVTAAVDIWSLGAMTLHLLSGEPPFGTGLRVVKNILDAKIPTIPGWVIGSPQFAPLAQEIWNLALSCLKKDPEQRPTADDLVKSCDDLCYTPSLRREGLVSSTKFNYGFITCDRTSIFFHQSSVYGPSRVKTTDRVIFAAYPGGGADRAFPVLRCEP